MSTTHAEAYVRTEAGRAEIAANGMQLSRPARNLLMVLDASRTGEQWIGKINGSSAVDLDLLLEQGLVVPKSSSNSPDARRWVPLEAALRGWTYDTLYTLLTQEAKQRFGLVKGYLLILKIEGCADLAALQAVAVDFVEQIRKAHGEESAVRFRRRLGATD